MEKKVIEYKECPECCGESTWYGLAPHRHNMQSMQGGFIGTTEFIDKKDYPDNFSEDPEEQGAGVWSCTNCNGNGVVNLDGSIIEG